MYADRSVVVALDLVTHVSARNIWIRPTTCSWPLARVRKSHTATNVHLGLSGPCIDNTSDPARSHPCSLRSDPSEQAKDEEQRGTMETPGGGGDGKSKSPAARVDCDVYLGMNAHMI